MSRLRRPIFGLTGGIASGKTRVSHRFTELGVSVIDTDVIAREVVALGSEGLQRIAECFGVAVLLGDGSLNRAALRERVFTDANQRQQLEAITHPRIRAQVQMQVEAVASGYAIVVVPLLVEKGKYDFMHSIIVVDCQVQTQLNRLMTRDSISAELATQMMSSQTSRAQRLAQATHVLSNDDQDNVYQSIDKLHQRLLAVSV